MRFLAAVVVGLLCLAAPTALAAPVVVLRMEGAIGPATADYVHRGLDRAARSDAPLVVIRMDTPGGLDSAMRSIIKDILGSPVPVAAYVYPTGARAASAGTYILYASHVAAMAPATNLGAATPVQLGGVPSEPARKPGEGKDRTEPTGEAMARKQMHDAAAYIRSLAQLRGRNAEWAEQAVREAVSLSASEALEKRVIDLVATDTTDLLKRVDGRRIEAGGRTRVLKTAGAGTMDIEPDWRNRVLSAITDPSIAYILLLLGVYGLFFEFANPGFVLPGVAGAICLLLALFALQLLPVSYAGLALILLGLAFIAAEAFVPSFGALGLGGLAAFVIGSVMLIDAEAPDFGIPWSLIGVVALVSAAFLFAVAWLAAKARRRPVVSGREELAGSEGEMLEDCHGEGWARVHGELWKVRCAHPIAKGEKVQVVGTDGLVLQVVKRRE